MAACEAFVAAPPAGRVRVQLRNHKLTGRARAAAARRRARCHGRRHQWASAAQHEFITEINCRISRLRRWVPRRIGNGQFWIWDNAGAVAFAGWTDAPPDAARIAPVYTPPPLRGRGYATALVAALSQALLDDGRQRLFLITDLANPVSNAIYAKIGFQPQSDLFHFDFLDPSQ
jgi:predicted GNAT family acetyltransferase